MPRSTSRSLLARLSLLSLPHHATALQNANFFYFPSLSEPIPQVIAGDTVNVSWSSNYANGDLYVHCNGTQESVTARLNSTATEPVVIRSTWASPCHFQLGITDGYGWFDSGYVEIVANAAGRATTTWAATGSCVSAASTSTAAAGTASSAAGPSSSTTMTTTAGSAAGIAGEGSAAACAPKSGPGVGAGIGIGIGISAACAAVPMAFLLLRRRRRRGREGAEEKQGAQGQGWGEHYNKQGGTPEIAGREYQELSGQSNVIELDGQQGRK